MKLDLTKRQIEIVSNVLSNEIEFLSQQDDVSIEFLNELEKVLKIIEIDKDK